MKPLLFAAAALACLWGAGCRNALYFYETDKLSLTLEARPDATQPVSGSFGFKQRVAIVVPSKANHHVTQDAAAGCSARPDDAPKVDSHVASLGTLHGMAQVTSAQLPLASTTQPGAPAEKNNKTSGRDPAADALSMISFFDFQKRDGPQLDDPVLIRSGLITGAAALALVEKEGEKSAARAFAALATAAGGRRTAAMASINLAVRELFRLYGDESGVELARLQCEKSAESIYAERVPLIAAKVVKNVGPPPTTSVSLAEWTPDELDSTSRTPHFAALWAYRDELAQSVAALETWAADNKVSPLDIPVVAAPAGTSYEATVAAWAQWNAQTNRLAALDARIGSSDGIQRAFEMYIEMLRSGK